MTVRGRSTRGPPFADHRASTQETISQRHGLASSAEPADARSCGEGYSKCSRNRQYRVSLDPSGRIIQEFLRGIAALLGGTPYYSHAIFYCIGNRTAGAGSLVGGFCDVFRRSFQHCLRHGSLLRVVKANIGWGTRRALPLDLGPRPAVTAEVSRPTWAVRSAAFSLPASLAQAAGTDAVQGAFQREAACVRVASVGSEEEFAAEEQAHSGWVPADCSVVPTGDSVPGDNLAGPRTDGSLLANLVADGWARVDCSVVLRGDDSAQAGSVPDGYWAPAGQHDPHCCLDGLMVHSPAVELRRDSPERYKVLLPAWPE